MPTDIRGFESMLSTEFKDMVANPLYGLPQIPFTGVYTATLNEAASGGDASGGDASGGDASGGDASGGDTPAATGIV